MKPKYISLLALFFVGTLIFTPGAGLVFAQSRQDLEQKIRTKQDEIKKLEEQAELYRKEAAEKQKESTSLKKEISLVESKIKALNNEIKKTSLHIDKTTLEIDFLNNEIASLNEAMGRQRTSLAEVLQNLYEKRGESMVEIALKYEKISDIFGQVQNLATVQQALKESLTTLRELKQTKEQREEETLQKRGELEQLKTNLHYSKLTSQNEEQDRKKLLSLTKNAESRYQQLIKQTESQRLQTLREIEQLEAELRRLIDPSSFPEANPGLLAWPIDRSRAIVAQGYGRTPFARRSHYYEFHNGIDICPKQPSGGCDDLFEGEPVMSAEEGEVIGTGDSDQFCWKGSYGRWILIRHKNGLSTLYAHMALISVKKGDVVKRRQVIGTMGSTGLVTGPHVHFTVYASNTVSIRPSRICGLLPFGGSLNPMDYL